MQQHRNIDINKIIEQIENQTNRITSILNEINVLDPESLEEIDKLYDEREEPLKLFKEWYFSNEGRNFVLNFPGKWNEIIDPIISLDKNNLIALQQHLEIKSIELKNLVRSKSLMIYSKDK